MALCMAAMLKGQITFWSRDQLRTYPFQENGAGLKITSHCYFV